MHFYVFKYLNRVHNLILILTTIERKILLSIYIENIIFFNAKILNWKYSTIKNIHTPNYKKVKNSIIHSNYFKVVTQQEYVTQVQLKLIYVEVIITIWSERASSLVTLKHTNKDVRRHIIHKNKYLTRCWLKDFQRGWRIRLTKIPFQYI